MDNICVHKDMIKSDVAPAGPRECAECVAQGDSWIHLRLCLTCGHIGCCDSSFNKHARKHAHDAGHPIVQSFEPGETWKWCYVDDMMLD